MASFTLVPLEMDWFFENIDEYLKREEFQEFQEYVGVDYRDALEPEKRHEVVDRICNASSIFYEIRRAKGGAFFPEKVYREDVNFYNKAPKWVPEADELILHRPMCYSLNLRFKTISEMIVPYVLERRFKDREGIIIGNLGCGLGKDLHESVKRYSGQISRVISIDSDGEAIQHGLREMPDQLEGKIKLYEGNFLRGNPEGEKYDLCLLVGVICPLTNESSIYLLSQVRKQMAEKATIAVSSSSFRMHHHDPLCSFNIQLTSQWALNCRTEDDLYGVLSDAGFERIEILREPSGFNYIGIGTKI